MEQAAKQPKAYRASFIHDYQIKVVLRKSSSAGLNFSIQKQDRAANSAQKLLLTA